MQNSFNLPIFYAGFDPGTGEASLTVVPHDDVELATDTLTIPSLIARGNAQTLLKRGDTDATIAQVLRPGETLVSYQNTDYFLCDLLKEGKNATDSMSDPNRYWSSHARVLLLALACSLIPETSFVLRVVTALPVTLYTRENRQRMKDELSGYYRFEFNGRIREVYIIVGYVAMEGQGALISCGDREMDQAVIDIGKRTCDAIGAEGQKLITSLCGGNETLGVGRLVDAIQEVGKMYKRVISVEKAHQILYNYVHDIALPTIPVGTGSIPQELLVDAIVKETNNTAKEIMTFIASLWNVEGEEVGERFGQILIAGGGAYYFARALATMLPRVRVPERPETANIRGYLELALSLESKKTDIWEVWVNA